MRNVVLKPFRTFFKSGVEFGGIQEIQFKVYVFPILFQQNVPSKAG